jgi:peptide/nickel transport system substrate-binding protein
MVASYDPKRGIRLVRNPRFHEWSPDAQPSGFPDEIIVEYGDETAKTTEAQTRAIERGRADVVSLQFPPPTLSNEVRTLFAPQSHVNPTLDSWYFILNTSLPPFSNLNARQALNYAVNRDKLIQLDHEPGLLRPSCQLLPLNVVGYRRYCPYTLDLAKAQRLVAASGTRGQPVTIWIDKQRPSEQPIGAYLLSVLQSLGYKARLRQVKRLFPLSFRDDQSLYGALGDPRMKVQIGGTVGWAPDYPSANEFFSPLLTCASCSYKSATGQNTAEFCNPSIDAEIARARELQLTDPQAGSALWTKIDHDIVNQAPMLFLWSEMAIDFVSRRVGDYTHNPWSGVLLDQLWVR